MLKHLLYTSTNVNGSHNTYTLRSGLYGDDPLATVRLPHRGLSSQSLGK